MATDDLWGKLPDVEEIKTPFVLLKEQAELLTEKTDGLLVGEVAPEQLGQSFHYTLYIIVPTLNNYKLLSIGHMIGFYPLRLIESEKESVVCSDENEFKKELGEIFKSQGTQNVISKLLTHVRSA